LNRATPNLITQRIQEALEAACPLTPIKPSFRIGWWTEELQKLKKLTRVSLHEANAQAITYITKITKNYYKFTKPPYNRLNVNIGINSAQR